MSTTNKHLWKRMHVANPLEQDACCARCFAERRIELRVARPSIRRYRAKNEAVWRSQMPVCGK